MSFDAITSGVARYYSARLAEHGATARGVDWNSTDSQVLRFDQLLEVCDVEPFSLLDYGCGYGGLLEHLRTLGRSVSYVGYDIAEPMVEEARRRHGSAGVFTSDESSLSPAEFTVASGIFNVRLETGVEEWTAYVDATVDRLAELSTHGFAFNMLTSYSDADRMRDDLYYGDPFRFFDRAKRRYSRHLALLHDYGLYEWTLIVRLGR